MLSRGVIAVATVKSIESRVADRGFWLQTGCAVKAFTCSGACKGAFRVDLSEKEWTVHDETIRLSEGYWERIEEEEGRAVGSANFYRR
jgi:hypothetical protein